jgi:hypothetical protein
MQPLYANQHMQCVLHNQIKFWTVRIPPDRKKFYKNKSTLAVKLEAAKIFKVSFILVAAFLIIIIIPCSIFVE